LAPRTVEHEMLFVEGKEIFLYNDVDDCVNQIGNLLSISFAEALEIRENAQLTAQSQHTYKQRASKAAEMFESRRY
jgi:spore maturation protein CgeB